MKSYETLPEGYKKILHIDLQKDKKLMLIVNGLALVVSLFMFIPAVYIVPVNVFFSYDDPESILIKVAVMLVGFVVYMLLHEAVHGIAMRRFCAAKVKYGFAGMYAYAGSDGYYCKKDYITIALAPIVVWGSVLLILNFLVSTSWFYVVYFIQVGNISGAAGDLYVTWRMRKLPADSLIQDSGVSMTVFSKEAMEE